MLRSLLLALAALTATAHADELPLPKDATPQGSGAPSKGSYTKGGEGRIRTYDVPRARKAVTDDERSVLKAAKWEIVKDEPSPSGNATRIQTKKDGKLWKVSITGDKDKTVIIVTAP